MKTIELPRVGQESYSVKLLIGPDTVVFAVGNNNHVIAKGDNVECCDIGDVIHVAQDRRAFINGAPSYYIKPEGIYAYIYSTREENIIAVCKVEVTSENN